MKIVNITMRATYEGTDEGRLNRAKELREVLIHEGLLPPDYPEILYYHHDFNFLTTSDYMAELMSWKGYDVKLCEYNKFVPGFIQALAAATEKRPHHFHWEQGPFHPDFNQRVEVHTPGNALALFNDIMLAEDCCTDALQNSLNEGWRIIAVCPQPDQRRPDYILGRFNPDRDAKYSAAARVIRLPDETDTPT